MPWGSRCVALAGLVAASATKSKTRSSVLLQVTPNGQASYVRKERVEPEEPALASLLEALAGHEDVGQDTRSLFRSLRVCAQCEDFQRFGEPNDGGYMTCMDAMPPGAVRAAYSLGVEHHDQWSDDVARKLKVPVNQFDCTVSVGPPCADCTFFPKCIRSEDGKNDGFPGRSVTMGKALDMSGQAEAPDRSLLLKMDIEGSEWPILVAENKDLLRKFRQIIIEFHGLDQEARHPTYVQALSTLREAGFHVAHIHGNNYAGMYNIAGYRLPNVLEVTYVSGSDQIEHCVSGTLELPLDAPNNPSAPELPPAKLAAA